MKADVINNYLCRLPWIKTKKVKGYHVPMSYFSKENIISSLNQLTIAVIGKGISITYSKWHHSNVNPVMTHEKCHFVKINHHEIFKPILYLNYLDVSVSIYVVDTYSRISSVTSSRSLKDRSSQAMFSGHSTRSRASWYRPWVSTRLLLERRITLLLYLKNEKLNF